MGNYSVSWYSENSSQYQISDAASLAGLAVLVNNGTNFFGKTVLLTDNISLDGHLWTPIGDRVVSGFKYEDDTTQNNWRVVVNAFSGIFDGNGKTISNMVVNKTSPDSSYDQGAGLFAHISGATIRNLTLDNCTVSTMDGRAAIVAAFVYGGNSVFENITINDTCDLTADGGWSAGAIVGQIWNYSDYNVGKNNSVILFKNINTSADIRGYYNVGSLWGSITEALVTCTFNNTHLDGNAYKSTGYDTYIIVENCSNHGDIIAYRGTVGSLAGWAYCANVQVIGFTNDSTGVKYGKWSGGQFTGEYTTVNQYISWYNNSILTSLDNSHGSISILGGSSNYEDISEAIAFAETNNKIISILHNNKIVNINPTNKQIFANGTPIMISDGSNNNSKLSFISDDKVILDNYDLSSYAIFGGSKNASVDSTSITMTGGTVKNIYAGGLGSEGTIAGVGGNTLSYNAVSKPVNDEYDAKVIISGGNVTTKVAGGGVDYAYVGSVSIEISENAIVGNVTGGGNNLNLSGFTENTNIVGYAHIMIKDGAKIQYESGDIDYGSVYGGGFSYAYVGEAEITVGGNAYAAYVTGGGMNGVTNKSTINVLASAKIGVLSGVNRGVVNDLVLNVLDSFQGTIDKIALGALSDWDNNGNPLAQFDGDSTDGAVTGSVTLIVECSELKSSADQDTQVFLGRGLYSNYGNALFKCNNGDYYQHYAYSSSTPAGGESITPIATNVTVKGNVNVITYVGNTTNSYDPTTFVIGENKTWSFEDGAMTSTWEVNNAYTNIEINGKLIIKNYQRFVPAPLADKNTGKIDLSTYAITVELANNNATISITAKDVPKHVNGAGTEGYWVGVAISIPESVNNISNSKYYFGTDFSGTLTAFESSDEFISDGKSYVCFYSNVGDSTPKNHIVLDWDGNGEADELYTINFSKVTKKSSSTGGSGGVPITPPATDKPVVKEEEVKNDDGTTSSITETTTKKENADGSKETTVKKDEVVKDESGKTQAVKEETTKTTENKDGSKETVVEKKEEVKDESGKTQAVIEEKHSEVVSKDGSVNKTSETTVKDSAGKVVEEKIEVKIEDKNTGVSTSAEITKDSSGKTTSEIKTEASIETKDGKAEVDSKAVDAALKQAEAAKKTAEEKGVKDATPVIEINAEKSKDFTETQIATDDLSKLAEAEVDVKIKIAAGEVHLPPEVSKNLSSNKDEKVSLAFGEADKNKLTEEQKKTVGDAPVFEFNLKSGDKDIHDLGGTAKVTVPYELKKGEDANKITVWYLDEEGKPAAMNSVYDSETKSITFETSHFSYYFIAEDAAIRDDNKDSSNTIYYAVAAVIIILIIIALAYYFMKKKQ